MDRKWLFKTINKMIGINKRCLETNIREENSLYLFYLNAGRPKTFKE